jgi:predicted nucleic acid-binding protein
MPWAYFDTSALIKRYVDEEGRREVLRLLRSHDVVTSAVLPLELRSALRRRVTEGTVDGTGAENVMKRVTTDRVYWTLIPAGNEVLAAAESLVSAHPLRALDAIHLASAQLFAAGMPMTELIFVSADIRQAEVAMKVGMKTRQIR